MSAFSDQDNDIAALLREFDPLMTTKLAMGRVSTDNTAFYV